jgi:hypothetical protein
MFFLRNLYRERTNRDAKNDQATRKSPGHITWVRALILKTKLNDTVSMSTDNLCFCSSINPAGDIEQVIPMVELWYMLKQSIY